MNQLQLASADGMLISHYLWLCKVSERNELTYKEMVDRELMLAKNMQWSIDSSVAVMWVHMLLAGFNVSPEELLAIMQDTDWCIDDCHIQPEDAVEILWSESDYLSARKRFIRLLTVPLIENTIYWPLVEDYLQMIIEEEKNVCQTEN